MNSPAAKREPAADLASVWKEVRDRICRDVEGLSSFALALLGGTPPEKPAHELVRTAHHLAGTLGTFGAPRGTEAARRVEQLLSSELVLSGEHIRELSGLVVDLQEAIVAADRFCAGHPGFADRRRRSSAITVPPAGERRSPSPAVAGPRVLLVDVPRGEDVAAALAGTGARAAPVATVADALAALAKAPASLVVLSLGRVTLERARPLLYAARSQDVPADVIVVGAVASTASRLELARLGVTLVLPAESAPSAVTAAVMDSIAHVLRPEPAVLVVEDASGGTGVATRLSDEPMRVVVLTEPDRLWPVIDEVEPDVVIFDFAQLGTAASELCAAIRSDHRWGRVPVLVVTADAEEAGVQRVFAAGADDEVTTPISSDMLVARVLRQVRRVAHGSSGIDVETGLATRETAEAVASRLRRFMSKGERLAVAVIAVTRAHNEIPAVAATVLARRAAGVTGIAARWSSSLVVAVFPTTNLRSAARDLDVGARAMGAMAAIGVIRGDEPLTQRVDALEGEARVVGATVVGVREGDYSTRVDVIVVEDDPMMADLIVRGLQGRGISTAWLGDGLEAVELLCGATPKRSARVLVLDIDLPGLSGTDVLRRLAADGVLATTEVIVLTARSGESEIVEAFELGAIDHVSKPFSVPILMQRVRCALDRT